MVWNQWYEAQGGIGKIQKSTQFWGNSCQITSKKWNIEEYHDQNGAWGSQLFISSSISDFGIVFGKVTVPEMVHRNARF